jgi:hypothetical protein
MLQLGTSATSGYIKAPAGAGLSFQTNATPSMTILANGSVGVGITSPTALLHLASAVSGSSSIAMQYTDSSVSDGDIYGKIQWIGTDASSNASGVRAEIRAVARDTDAGGGSTDIDFMTTVGFDSTLHTVMTINADEYVGIGTTSPSGKFHVKSSANADYVFTGTSALAYITTFNMDNTGLKIGHDSASRSLQLLTNSAARVTVTGAGAVGIGTASPTSAQLHIVGGAGLTVETTTTPWVTLKSSLASINYLAMLQPASASFLGYIGGGGNGAITAASSADLAIRAENILIFAAGGNTERMRIDSVGRVNIGATTGLKTLNVSGNLGMTGTAKLTCSEIELNDPNTLLGTIIIKQVQPDYGVTIESSASSDDWQIFINESSGNDLTFEYNSSTRGYIDSATNVSNIDFTGQHRSSSVDMSTTDGYTGHIVISTGVYCEPLSGDGYSISINESIPKISLSATANDKRVFGVISDSEESGDYREYYSGSFVSVTQKNPSDTRFVVNSAGEGGIYVCNVNGNFENGDYITTCEIPGMGAKQSDGVMRNYTVAKITTNCNFDLNSTDYICEELTFNASTYRRAFVGCTYHCG